MTFTRIVLLLVVLSAPFARAQDDKFDPSNPPEMTVLTNHNSRAYQTAARLLRGVNLGNYLEIPAGQDWGVRITTNDFDHIKTEGFDHVRAPIAWQEYAGPAPEFKLSAEIFSHADFVVTNCLSRGLAVMVNIHHFDDFTADPVKQTDKFIVLWRQIAAHYASSPDTVVFELLNEPRDAASTPVLNKVYPQVIAEIRKTNPNRTIVVSGSDWGGIGEVKNLVLPADDDNLIVTFHCYDPFRFTHQGAPWAGADVLVTGIVFPGPPAVPLVPNPALDLSKGVRNWLQRYNSHPRETNPSSAYAFAGKLKWAHDWSAYYGRPVYVGEFGAYERADAESRAHYYGEFRRACEAQNLGWAIWDWSAGFRYWDAQKNQAAPGMREAVFGKK